MWGGRLRAVRGRGSDTAVRSDQCMSCIIYAKVNSCESLNFMDLGSFGVYSRIEREIAPPFVLFPLIWFQNSSQKSLHVREVNATETPLLYVRHILKAFPIFVYSDKDPVKSLNSGVISSITTSKSVFTPARHCKTYKILSRRQNICFPASYRCVVYRHDTPQCRSRLTF